MNVFYIFGGLVGLFYIWGLWLKLSLNQIKFLFVQRKEVDIGVVSVFIGFIRSFFEWKRREPKNFKGKMFIKIE